MKQEPTKEKTNQEKAPEQKEQPKPESKSKSVEDKGLIDSLLFLKESNALPKSNSKVKYETVKEAEDAAKEDVAYAVNERVNNIKQDISDLQKKGYDLRIDGIKLLTVPLKMRVWNSDPSRKDLEPLFVLFTSLEKKLEPLKKEVADAQAKKEAAEKEAQEKSKTETQDTKKGVQDKKKSPIVVSSPNKENDKDQQQEQNKDDDHRIGKATK